MKKTFRILAIMAYVISAISTGIFLVSMGESFIEKIMGLLITLLFEPGKCVSFISIFRPCKNPIIKTATIVLWIVLEIGSVTASTAYMMNVDGKQQQKSITNSTAYREIEAKKENISDLIQLKENEITKLQKEKESTITQMTADKDNLPKNYLSAKADLQLKINQASSTLQQNIEKLNTEILTLTNELNNTSVTSVKSESTNGYTRIFNTVAGLISSEESQVKGEHIALIFSFLIFGILPELMANVFFWYSQNEGDPISDSSTSDSYISKNRIGRYLQTFDMTGDKGRIGFKQDNDRQTSDMTDFTDDDLKKYLKYMYDTHTHGVCKGYSSISSSINVPLETCRSIRKHLERQGIIKTDGTKTLILDYNYQA
jgi:hypothetical protein